MIEITEIELGVTADMHVHLREGKMMELITPTVREGGVAVAYIMPNLVPPITTIDKVVEYKKQLEALSPTTTFLMSFYLSKDLSPELINEAAKIGAIQGVKCYPAGVTTNSAHGVDPNDFTAFYPIFEALEANNLVLNIHGESPPKKDSDDIHILNAESKFLPILSKLHSDFPNLKIILEHCTSQDAVEAIEKLNAGYKDGDKVTVAGTITAHHLSLTIDSWAGNPINFCKPVAKFPSDRNHLVKAATSGKPYFFFGSDSAPHPIEGKARHTGVCAGIYTQKYALSYVAEVFEKNNKLENLKTFVTDAGVSFYEVKDVKCSDKCWLVKDKFNVPEVISSKDVTVVPFKAGDELQWKVEWRK
ncbi:Dihydroorotase homodimeric type [Yamadazyma tenuis ATCC 10573]|uniref:dihydroorotase n=2 Tax=Candida tenuis TaxID=2315449 RepID=G3AXZ3_CANTC|nr:Dihydroorotase homodimeric type [Yamadazyma tenuis ATCC 10573]EGV65729.1 Dihydroorotase homodimeric type [Yamadazyma tenuis ATCC 10573]